MANETQVLVDALPYIDSGYEEPGIKQTVFQLIEEECRRYRPTKNYLEVFGPVNLYAFETEILRNEFQRMEQRLPMEILNMKRYELPPPPAAKISEPAAWLECVENSYAQLEHQASRIVNLELMTEFGAASWRIYNQTLKTMFESAEKQIEELRKQIQNVNLNRKTEQTLTGQKLNSLESRWVGLVSKNYEIECAIVELEKELNELKRKKTAENNVATLEATEASQNAEEEDEETNNSNSEEVSNNDE